MKKNLSLVLGILLLAMTTGCGDKSPAPTQEPSNNATQQLSATEAASQIETNTQDASQAEKKDPRSAKTESSGEDQTAAEAQETDHTDTILSYLEGDWHLLNDGSGLYNEGDWDSISFDTKEMLATYTTFDGRSAVYSFELSDLFSQEKGMADMLILRDTDADKYDGNFYIGADGAAFQLFLADNNGWDDMILRPVGNQDILLEQATMYRSMPVRGCYALSRNTNGDDNKMQPANDPAKYRIAKDSIFYAIKWLEYGNSTTLQEVELWVEQPSLFGMNEEVYAYKPIDDEYRNVAINYNYKGKEDFCHDGYFSPVLVEVETDSNGEIIRIDEMAYADDGYYYPYGEEAMDSTRDHRKFGAADKVYVGEWAWNKEKDSTLEISPDSEDLGGYAVHFDFYRLEEFHGNASFGDGVLVVDAKAHGSGLKLKGAIYEKDGGLEFLVTDSEFEFITAGSVYDYVKVEE